MIRKVALALGLTLFSGSTAWAIPQTLNFQGLLKESGSPVNDTRQMTFKIWDSPSGGSAVFTEPASGTTDVIVSTGVFSFTIGSIISGGIPLSVFDGSDRYVEVVVGTTTLPRQKITSVGNAFFAATAANLVPTATIQISSISASSATFTAFSVGGSTLVVAAGRIGVGTSAPATNLDVNGAAQFGNGATKSTFTATPGGSAYALQLSSGVTISNGGPINLSAGGYIKFNDGTTMTSTASLSSGGVSIATYAFTYLNDEYTNTGAAMGPCIGSTISFTTSGNRVEIFFDFSQAHGASGGATRVQVLMDGAWIDDFGPSESMAPISRDPGASSTAWFPTSLHYITDTAPSAGSHRFCITFERNSGGTSYITCKKAGTVEGPKKCLFMVRELK